MRKAGKDRSPVSPPADSAILGASEPEFSRPVAVDRLGESGLALELVASAAERAALARHLGLLALEQLSGRAAIDRVDGGPVVRLRVAWTADVVQSCVVTLDPVPARLDEAFEQRFVPPAAKAGPAREVFVDVGEEAEEPPEPLIGGRIDIGAALAEQLALALDPYPRKPGAALTELADGPPVEGGGMAASHERSKSSRSGPGPFSALERWRRRTGGGRED